MMRFREFVKNAGLEEEMQDIKKTLAKLPPSHAALVKGYHWKFHAGNTLNGDTQHVGYVDDNTKEIAVAAPWNYGREFTILHEVGHKVWENYIAPHPQLVHQWNHLVMHMTPEQKGNDTLKQEPEELFCMSYAQKYAENKIEKFDNPLWQKFIDQIPS